MIMLALVELYQYNIVTGTIQYQSLNTKAMMIATIVMVMTVMIRRALQIAETADVHGGSGGDSEPKK